MPAVLSFIQKEAGLDAREAYGTFNMGAGFAVFVPAEDAERAVAVARKAGVDAWVAGSVEAGPRRLVIEPLDVEYGGERTRRSPLVHGRAERRPPRIDGDGPPRMGARPTGSGRERSSPNRCDQCRGQARHLSSLDSAASHATVQH